jgi:hypothetical protein
MGIRISYYYASDCAAAAAIPAEKVTGSALLAGFSGKSLRKPVFENLAASGLAGLAGMAAAAATNEPEYSPKNNNTRFSDVKDIPNSLLLTPVLYQKWTYYQGLSIKK